MVNSLRGPFPWALLLRLRRLEHLRLLLLTRLRFNRIIVAAVAAKADISKAEAEMKKPKAAGEQQGRFQRVMFQNMLVLLSLSIVLCTVIYIKLFESGLTAFDALSTTIVILIACIPIAMQVVALMQGAAVVIFHARVPGPRPLSPVQPPHQPVSSRASRHTASESLAGGQRAHHDHHAAAQGGTAARQRRGIMARPQRGHTPTIPNPDGQVPSRTSRHRAR